MRSLSDAQLIQAWDAGQQQHPIDRALILLTLGYPERSTDDLLAMSVGLRDAHLLALRQETFGPQLDVRTACPQCGEQLELNLQVNDLLMVDIDQPPNPPPLSLSFSGFEWQMRLPNSQDLAAVADMTDVNAARQTLEQRCLLAVRQAGQPIEYEALPTEALTAFSQQLAQADPQAEMLFNLDCPACQHHWQTLFDIVTFFWTEIGVQTRRLLQEVDALARTYSWREADILAMGAFRRRQYLNLMT